MTTTIKDQIITAFETRLAIIRQSNGYNTDVGKNVFRAIRKHDSTKVECVTIWPGMDEKTPDYGKNTFEFSMVAEGEKNFKNDENPSEIAEQIMGDLIEAITGVLYAYPFTSGGTHTAQGGEDVEGDSSEATGHIESITVNTGTWAGGDAAGTIYLRRVVGTFENEVVNIDDSDAMTFTGMVTGQSAVDLSSGGLADSVAYVGGGVESYPDSGDAIIGVQAEFRVRYRTVLGDPYNQ